MKSLVFGKMITLLLMGVFAISIGTLPANASESIYIRADGSIDPPTANITTSDNATYVFTNDINEGIVIQRSNITLDGKGHTLRGSGTDYGISLSIDCDNFTINNVTISDFHWGILILSDGNTINGSNITCGIDIGVSAHNTISNNTILGNDDVAIHCYYGVATTIINNDIEDGICLIRGHSNKVSENRITGIGITCNASSNNVVQRNLIEACPVGIELHSVNYTGIPQHPTNNTIVENEIVNCTTGLSLHNARNTTVWHNYLVDNTNQVSGGNTTTWDNGYPSGGNYWSDYEERYPNATEMDGSGIWDTPYVIDDNNQDNYPLIPELPSAIVLLLVLMLTVTMSVCWSSKQRTHGSSLI